MSWFAWQRGPAGCIPVVFSERPEPGQVMTRTILKSSIQELPPELEGEPLSRVAAWAVATLPRPAGGIAWYESWGEPPTTEAEPATSWGWG